MIAFQHHVDALEDIAVVVIAKGEDTFRAKDLLALAGDQVLQPGHELGGIERSIRSQRQRLHLLVMIMLQAAIAVAVIVVMIVIMVVVVIVIVAVAGFEKFRFDRNAGQGEQLDLFATATATVSVSAPPVPAASVPPEDDPEPGEPDERANDPPDDRRSMAVDCQAVTCMWYPVRSDFPASWEPCEFVHKARCLVVFSKLTPSR